MKRSVLFISILLSSFGLLSLSASAASCNKTVSAGASIQNVVNGAVAGDVICVRGGTYHQTVSVSKSGTATSPITIQNYPGETVVIDGQKTLPSSSWGALITIGGSYVHMSGFEVKNTSSNNARGVAMDGHHNKVSFFNVHHSHQNGIYARGDYSIVEDSKVWSNALSNVNGSSSMWAGGLNVARDVVNGFTDGAIIRRNVVYNNWGEGLSSFEATGTLVENNIVYNNWSVNLYISDSKNVIVRNNLVYNASPNQASARPGSLTVADELASKPRSYNVQITNNIVYGTSLCEACWTIQYGMSQINANHNTIVGGSLKIGTSNGTGIVQSANCTLTASQVPGLGTVTPGSLTPAKFANASCPSGTGADVTKFGTSGGTTTTTPPPTASDPISGNLEAEKYTSKSGAVSIITSSGIGASSGAYMGYTANGDVLVYNNINLSGITSFQARVATAKTGSSIEVRTGSASGALIGTVTIPSTGGWAGTNTWQTITAPISGATGAQNVYLILKGTTGGVADVDWLQFVQSSGSAIEAERYSSKTGSLAAITSSTVGASAGSYIGYTANGNVLVFNNVDLTGVTGINVRAATAVSGSYIEVRTGGSTGTLIGKVTIPSTGGWAGTNTWQTVTGAISGVTGEQNLYLVLKGGTGGIADIDWLKFVSSAPSTPASSSLSTNRAVTASSVQDTNSAAYAVDGNIATRWSSTFSDPQWISVDLGSSKSINRVVLNWEAAYGKNYNIQVSNDNSSWTTIYTTTTGNGGTDDLTNLSGIGRYIRMYGTARATAYGYSLYEMEVYGSDATTTPPPTTTPVSTKFVANDRVMVENGPINVRSTANLSGTVLGTQQNGVIGTVVGGPVAQGGYIWWNVNYDSGVDGWSAENYLVKYTAGPVSGTSENIWGTRTTSKFSADSRSWELGTIFTPTASGQVTGARVYGAPNESGAHSVRLWRNSDSALISGPHSFTYSGQGWKTFTFPTPVSLTANQSYTIAVSTGSDTSKWYASIQSGLVSGGSNGNHLTYPANAGVYTEVMGTRPIKVFQSENYLRDITFVAEGTTSGTTTPPPTTPTTTLPLGTIEAERYSSKLGSASIMTNNGVGASGGAYVGNTASGNVLVYNNVNLNGITSIQVRTATPQYSSYIEVRTGSMTGPMLGVVVLPNSGGWAGINSWRTTSAPINGSGTQNIYLVLRGGSTGVADIDWIKF